MTMYGSDDIMMEKTVEVIMSSVKESVKNNISERDFAQLGYTASQSIRSFPHEGKLDMLTSFRNETSTFISPLESGRNLSMQDYVEFKIAKIIWQVCPVFLFLFGTLGNILILIMLRSLRLGRTSMHLYLRALAISDLCVLYTGLLRQWIRFTFDTDIRSHHTFICKVHLWLVYVSLYVSAWLLVFMTLERTCSACLPHRVSTFCTKRRACFLIIFIVLFISCLHSHFFFGATLVTENGQQKCDSPVGSGFDLIHGVLPHVDLVLLSLLPFTFVIIGNVVIVWKTFVSLRTAAELNLASGNNALRRRRRASSMTVILLCLSALFLLTTSPSCVFNVWEWTGAADDAERTAQGKARVELAWALVNIVMYCNNTFNFYLYCLSGRKFRNEMKRQFSRRRTDSQSIVMSTPSLQLNRFPLTEFQNGNGRDRHHYQMVYQSSFYGRNSNAYL